MDVSTNELVKNFVGSAVRWALVLVGGILVKKGILTNQQNETYVAQLLPVAIGGAMALVALGWSLWQKKHADAKVDALITTATQLEPGTSPETVKTIQAEKDATK